MKKFMWLVLGGDMDLGWSIEGDIVFQKKKDAIKWLKNLNVIYNKPHDTYYNNEVGEMYRIVKVINGDFNT